MKIGLALSGGGAMGAAHIGVLEELERAGIKIDIVSGTSAGSIVGLLFVDGGTKRINHFIEQMGLSGLLSRTNLIVKRNNTIFKTIEGLLRENVERKNFSTLAKPFYCIGTDINSGEKEVFASGDPIEAVMASCAYPGVFPIQKVRGRYYIDGGVINNLPAKATREMGADFVIGSSLYSISSIEKNDETDLKLNPMSVALRAVDIMSKRLAEYEARNCDFCFEPNIEQYKWYDFHRIYEIREAGRKYAKENIETLITLLLAKEEEKKK